MAVFNPDVDFYQGGLRYDGIFNPVIGSSPSPYESSSDSSGTVLTNLLDESGLPLYDEAGFNLEEE